MGRLHDMLPKDSSLQTILRIPRHIGCDVAVISRHKPNTGRPRPRSCTKILKIIALFKSGLDRQNKTSVRGNIEG